MAVPESFQDQQYRFTGHIRDPQCRPAPADVEDRRMAIYRDLLYRNVEGFMASSFPVLRGIMEDGPWHAMIREFFKVHRSRTPYFPKLARELLHYLQHERQSQESDYPFMLELAQYEHAESMLMMDVRTVPGHGYDPDGDLLQDRPVLNPLRICLSCIWPVHRISPEYLPDHPPETPSYLLLSRNKEDRLCFTILNSVSARLIEVLGEEARQRNGRDILSDIARELGHPKADQVIASGMALMQDLRNKEILLGTVPV